MLSSKLHLSINRPHACPCVRVCPTSPRRVRVVPNVSANTVVIDVLVGMIAYGVAKDVADVFQRQKERKEKQQQDRSDGQTD